MIFNIVHYICIEYIVFIYIVNNDTQHNHIKIDVWIKEELDTTTTIRVIRCKEDNKNCNWHFLHTPKYTINHDNGCTNNRKRTHSSLETKKFICQTIINVVDFIIPAVAPLNVLCQSFKHNIIGDYGFEYLKRKNEMSTNITGHPKSTNDPQIQITLANVSKFKSTIPYPW